MIGVDVSHITKTYQLEFSYSWRTGFNMSEMDAGALGTQH
jgi:hypothetical protein